MNAPGRVPEAVRRALGSIAGFARATVVSRLSNGPTNQSWLIERDGARYVLRLDLPEARRLGLDRAAETNAQAIAATAGLTPGATHTDLSAGICLRPFEPGRSWQRADLRHPRRLERVAGLLRTLHHLPADVPDFDPFAAMQRYAAQLGTEQARERVTRARPLVEQLRTEPAPRSLCHNDLVCENIVEGEQLQLIDWEYAGMGDPLFDLAVVIQHHALEPEFSDHLLQSYFEGDVSPSARHRLELQCAFYQELLELWNLRIAP
ncbi:MAG: choline/ethanolamine kinase family protein [Lysobacterales bacterium]